MKIAGFMRLTGWFLAGLFKRAGTLVCFMPTALIVLRDVALTTNLMSGSGLSRNQFLPNGYA